MVVNHYSLTRDIRSIVLILTSLLAIKGSKLLVKYQTIEQTKLQNSQTELILHYIFFKHIFFS